MSGAEIIGILKAVEVISDWVARLVDAEPPDLDIDETERLQARIGDNIGRCKRALERLRERP